MAVHVVERACVGDDGLSKITVVLRSDKETLSERITELQDTNQARNLALRYAGSLGMHSPRLTGMATAAYPINRNGVPLDQVKGPRGEPLDMRHQDMQVADHWLEIPLVSAP